MPPASYHLPAFQRNLKHSKFLLHCLKDGLMSSYPLNKFRNFQPHILLLFHQLYKVHYCPVFHPRLLSKTYKRLPEQQVLHFLKKIHQYQLESRKENALFLMTYLFHGKKSLLSFQELPQSPSLPECHKLQSGLY